MMANNMQTGSNQGNRNQNSNQNQSQGRSQNQQAGGSATDDEDEEIDSDSNGSRGQGNKGNFANDPQRASEAGQKGGESRSNECRPVPRLRLLNW